MLFQFPLWLRKWHNMYIYIIYIVSTGELEQITNIQEDTVYLNRLIVIPMMFAFYRAIWKFLFNHLLFLANSLSSSHKNQTHPDQECTQIRLNITYHIVFLPAIFAKSLDVRAEPTKRMEAARCAKKTCRHAARRGRPLDDLPLSTTGIKKQRWALRDARFGHRCVHIYINYRWWFHIFFWCSSLPGKMFQFDEYFFQWLEIMN